MISETLRNDIWNNMGDTIRQSLYYAELAQKMEQNNFRMRIVLAVAGGTSALVSANIYPESWAIQLRVAQVGTGAFISLLIALSFAFAFDKKAGILHAVTTDIMLLRRDWKALWMEMEAGEIDEKTLRMRNRLLGERLEHLSSRADFAGVKDDDQLDIISSQRVERIMINEFKLEEN